MKHLLLIVVVAAGLGVLPKASPAQPQPAEDVAPPEDPQRLYNEGILLYGKEKFEQAAEKFEAAVKIDPKSGYLFAWAQTARQLNDCKTATLLLKRILRLDPSEEQATLTSQVLAECYKILTPEEIRVIDQQVEREIAAHSAPPPPEPVAPAEPLPQPEPETTPITAPPPDTGDVESPPSAARNITPFVVMGIGAAGLGVGTAMWVAANAADGRSSATHDDRISDLDDADRRRTISIIGFAAGAACLAGGAAWWWLGERAETDGPRLSGWAGRSGAGVVWTGTFD